MLDYRQEHRGIEGKVRQFVLIPKGLNCAFAGDAHETRFSALQQHIQAIAILTIFVL